MAGDGACSELLKLLPRILGDVVVGTNSVTRGLEKKTIRFVLIPQDSRSQHIPELAHRDRIPMVVLPAGSFEKNGLGSALKMKRVSVLGIRKRQQSQSLAHDATISSPTSPVAMEDFCAWLYRWQSAPTDAFRAKVARILNH